MAPGAGLPTHPDERGRTVKPAYLLGAAICLLILWGWWEVRMLDYRRRVTGCEHRNTYVSQMPKQYGEHLTLHCKGCSFQAPIRELHRFPGSVYVYALPGQTPSGLPQATDEAKTATEGGPGATPLDDTPSP